MNNYDCNTCLDGCNAAKMKFQNNVSGYIVK